MLSRCRCWILKNLGADGTTDNNKGDDEHIFFWHKHDFAIYLCFVRGLFLKSATFITSFRCWEMYIVTRWPLISIVCHHNVHLVVAIREKFSEDSSGLWTIDWKCFRLHRSVDSQPSQLATVSPVVELRDHKQNAKQFNFCSCRKKHCCWTIFQYIFKLAHDATCKLQCFDHGYVTWSSIKFTSWY